ncbi:MAG TPA: GNAT family N-acetyltransferase [Candidatus Eremiobacteraceae bacterium]|nr:GNAT family N-acetyltransferase [Candidatus Eremiobacteraceae bacterium]
MTAPIFRRATPSDGPEVRRIVFDTLRAYNVEIEPETHDRDVMTFGEPKNGVMEFVAELDGRVVGSVIVTPRDDGTGLLTKFFVDAGSRGRGVGRPLLEHAVTAARAAGLRRLELDTRTFFHEAIHLYESTGWLPIPAPAAGKCDLFYALEL